MSPNAVQSNNSCDTHSTSCGPGRENGFSSTFLSTGCRNWEGWSYGNYGATDIPFWIDMPSMNTIANTTHRNILINDIRTQAALWNDAVMHDAYGHIIGDKVIMEFSRRLLKMNDEHMFTARYDGDEFVTIVTRFENVNTLEKSIENKIKSIGSRIKVQDYTFDLTVSVGVAIYPFHGQDIYSLIG